VDLVGTWAGPVGVTWVRGAGDDHPFGLATLAYGAVSAPSDPRPRLAVRIGDFALDLAAACTRLRPDLAELVTGPTLNPLLATDAATWRDLRASVTGWLRDESHRPVIEALLTPLDGLTAHLPIEVADYVDFYASEHHATNVGTILRPDARPLSPNWKYLPIGYHGRAGTVVVSGTSIQRPSGQWRTDDGVGFGPSRRLDFEAEVGLVLGGPTAPGQPISVDDAREHIFGLCLLNDWSARDIQLWETVPLGPFLGKSFGTSISAWITPLDAFAAAWVPPPLRDPRPLPYLDDGAGPTALDLDIEVYLNGHLVSQPRFAAMYWTPPQLVAHLTVNGATVRAGDLLGSGTVSGPTRDQRGCLLELTWNGAEPLTLGGGSTRTFLEDGDEVVLTATAPGPRGGRIGLGEVRGRIASR
jgi:fumarylacetoacetase